MGDEAGLGITRDGYRGHSPEKRGTPLSRDEVRGEILKALTDNMPDAAIAVKGIDWQYYPPHAKCPPTLHFEAYLSYPHHAHNQPRYMHVEGHPEDSVFLHLPSGTGMAPADEAFGSAVGGKLDDLGLDLSLWNPSASCWIGQGNTNVCVYFSVQRKDNQYRR